MTYDVDFPKTDTEVSVEFDETVPINGKDGYTPVRGVDYWTDDDKKEIKGFINDVVVDGVEIDIANIETKSVVIGEGVAAKYSIVGGPSSDDDDDDNDLALLAAAINGNSALKEKINSIPLVGPSIIAAIESGEISADFINTVNRVLGTNYTIEVSKAAAILSIALGTSNESTEIGAITLGYGNKSDGFSSSAIGSENIVHGGGAFAYGHKNTIYGDFGTAIGQENIVGKKKSDDVTPDTTVSSGFAGGIKSQATGKGAFAFGNECKATGDYAVAMGGDTTASGKRSFACGNNTLCSADYAHAEGNQAKALGHSSHAEGELTEAKHYAHAEGYNTKAHGNHSHAEGSTTEALAQSSHTEGWNTKVLENAEGGHAEGYMSVASGEASHAEGSAEEKNGEWINPTTASGFASHAEGVSTKAIGKGSHSEGYNTEAGANWAHTEGWETKARAPHAHAEGSTTRAYGESTHAEGWNTQAGDYTVDRYGNKIYYGEGAHAEGFETWARGDASHAGGRGTIASVAYQTVVGTYNKEDASALFIVGNGTDKNNRSNAFSVYKDGSYVLGKKIATEEYANVTCTDKEVNATATTAAYKRHTLTQNGKTVCTIDVPRDLVVKSGYVDKATDELVLVLVNDETIRVDVSHLIEYVTGGTANDGVITIDISDDFKATATINDGTITSAKFADEVEDYVKRIISNTLKTETWIFTIDTPDGEQTVEKQVYIG